MIEGVTTVGNPPGLVHGGVLAEVFDEICGVSLVVLGEHGGGVTDTLAVRYRRPTPIDAEIEMVARPTTREGRTLGVVAAMRYAGEVTAEAEAVFVAVTPDRAPWSTASR